MQFPVILSALAIACGILASPLYDSANLPTHPLQGRNPEAMPIPTLFPQPKVARRDDKGKDITYGWINTDKDKGMLMTEKEKGPVSTTVDEPHPYCSLRRIRH
jgi:hypothetical protein